MTLAMAMVALAAGRAGAQTLDLYQGTVMGSPRVVAMGGAVAAVSEDMTATLATPAAMAFRPLGSTGWWDWDFYADTVLTSSDTDLTNSGLPASPDRPVSAGAGGACMYFGKWGIGVTGADVSYGLPPTTAGATPTTLSVSGPQLTVAARSSTAGSASVCRSRSPTSRSSRATRRCSTCSRRRSAAAYRCDCPQRRGARACSAGCRR